MEPATSDLEVFGRAVRDKNIPRSTWLSTRGDLPNASFLNYMKRIDQSWTDERMRAVLGQFKGKKKHIVIGGKKTCELSKATRNQGRKVTGEGGMIVCNEL